MTLALTSDPIFIIAVHLKGRAVTLTLALSSVRVQRKFASLKPSARKSRPATGPAPNAPSNATRTTARPARASPKSANRATAKVLRGEESSNLNHYMSIIIKIYMPQVICE